MHPTHDVHDLILQLQDDDVGLRLDALALVSDLGDMEDVGDIGKSRRLADSPAGFGDTGYRYDIGEDSPTCGQLRQLVEAVIQSLQDAHVQIRKMAALALGDIG